MAGGKGNPDLIWTVYCLIFPNDKKYIGITSDFKNRMRGHKNNIDKTYYKRPLTKAINKYGWDNIQKNILFEKLSKEEACQKEIELIVEYQTKNREFGYNLADGGGVNQGYKNPNVWCKGKKFSKELKEKLSKSKLEYWPNNPDKVESIRQSVIQYSIKAVNTVTGEEKIFRSGVECAKYLGVVHRVVYGQLEGETLINKDGWKFYKIPKTLDVDPVTESKPISKKASPKLTECQKYLIKKLYVLGFSGRRISKKLNLGRWQVAEQIRKIRGVK